MDARSAAQHILAHHHTAGLLMPRPCAWPAEAQRQGHAQGHPHLKYLQEGDTIGTEVDPIRAILVFHDPSDW